MATAGTLEYLISIDSSKVQSGLANAESKVKGFGDKLSAWTVAKGQLIGRLVERAGASTLNFVKGAVNESRNFDKSMSQVAATLGKSVDQMNKEVKTTTVKFGKEVKTFTGNLTEYARFMGQNTQYTAEQAANALNYMALAGYDTEKSMRMLPSVLNLASAGNMELARASDMVTDAQSALGLTLEETEGLVDKMAKTASKTNTSVEQLGDAMLTVGGTAKMMGSGSIDATTELSMALGVLADNGIKGSEGGTALRNVLLSLSAPTDKAAKKLKELGVEVYDSEGNMKDLPFILQDINEATKDMTQEQRTDFLNTVFNKRDLKSIEALLGTDMTKWEQLYREIGNADGAAAEMAATQLDNLEGDITKFKSALSEAKLSISDKLTPTLRKFTQKGTVWVQRLTNSFNDKGLSGALKEARKITKEFIADSLGIAEDSSWSEIGKTAVTKIKNGIKNAFKNAKINIADMLGVEDAENATWSDIAKKTVDRIKAKFEAYKVKVADLLGVEDAEDATWVDIAGKIVERIKGKINDAKIKIADLLGIEDAEDATWGTIASNIVDRIKAKFTAAKIKIADMLGVEDAEDATWGDIAGKITDRIKAKITAAKIMIADVLGVEDAEDATWGDIAKKITDRIKGKIGEAKIKIADLLGIEDAENATWGTIGAKITGRIRAKIGKAKIKVADLLGIEDAENATWGQIGSKITTRIKTKIGDAKLKIADLLGIESAEDATWGTIAGNIKDRLVGAFKNIKLKFADLVGIEDAGNATWGEIGGKIAEGIGDTFKKGKSLLLKILLGDDYEEGKSTFTDVGIKISQWIDEGFKEGGFLDSLVTGFFERLSTKWTTVTNIFASLINGLADWLSDQSNVQMFIDSIVKIVTVIAASIDKIIMPLFDAIIGAITSPGFVESLSTLASVLTNLLVKIITSEDLWNALGLLADTVLRSILGDNIVSLILGDKKKLEYYTNEKGERHTRLVEDKNAKQNESMVTKLIRGLAGTEAGSDTFGDRLVRWLGGDTDILSVIFGEKETKKAAEKLQEALNNIKMLITGEAHINLVVDNYGGTPGDVAMFNNLGSGAAHTKSFDGRRDPGKYPTLLVNPTELRGGAVSGGSYAKGAWDIPNDMYAELHRNEMVLTASQARRYRDGEMDTGAIVSAIQGLRNDMANLKLVVGKKMFGRAVTDYGGDKINDYIGGSNSRLSAGYGT